jgi:predicted Zn-dependent protease
MHGQAKIKKMLRLALSASRADQTEVFITAEDSALTRFANSYIHQNVAQRNGTISVRAIFGRKIGMASSNMLDEQSIRGTVSQACRIAKLQHDNPDFVSLPGPQKAGPQAPDLYFEETARISPAQRAEAVGKICRKAEKHKARAFGAFSTGTVEIGIANSLGLMQYNCSTDANLNTVVMSDTGSGYGQGASRDVGKININAVAESAVKKAVDSRNPVDIRPGRYPVILEDMAVYTLVEFMNHTGFSAMAVQEGRSFIGRNMGQPVVDPQITIVDDPYNKRGFAFPFDFEGVPKQRVTLIDRGIAKGVVYDSYTANKENKRSTGHALPAPAYFPMALNLEMKGGRSSIEEMIRDTERGIYVTRFHYCNLIDPMLVSLTGMTRDGTFLIEKGRITKPVKNLRFTESVLKALSKVSAVSKKTSLVTEDNAYGNRFANGILVPALKLESFNFSGATEF